MTRDRSTGPDTAAGVAKPRFRFVRIAGICAGLMIAATPAIAGIQPQPFLDFNFMQPPDNTSVSFIVTLPSSPVVPVEILSLSLLGTDPMFDILLSGRDSGQAGFVNFSIPVGQVLPADQTPVAFNLSFDVASYMGSNPVLADPPDDTMPGPVSGFDVLFDVGIDGGIVQHLVNFTSSQFLFSNVTTGAGSVAIGFDLTGPYTSGSPGLFAVSITGSATPVPEPATLGLFGVGLAGLGLMGWRTRRRERKPAGSRLAPA